VTRVALALLAGALFGSGLAYSGLADPMRVQGFLDLLGDWDPTLMFVMGGALVPMAIAWRLQARAGKPWLDERFELPGTRHLDARLVIGAILFGAGWGIGGLCPGPAFANLALAPLPALAFVSSMLVGMLLHRAVSD